MTVVDYDANRLEGIRQDVQTFAQAVLDNNVSSSIDAKDVAYMTRAIVIGLRVNGRIESALYWFCKDFMSIDFFHRYFEVTP